MPPSLLLPSYIGMWACCVQLGGKRAQAGGAHVQPSLVGLALVSCCQPLLLLADSGALGKWSTQLGGNGLD